MMLSKIYSKYDSLTHGKKAAIWFVFCSFLQKGISFLVTPLFTRLLSTEQFGYWTLFQSWETVLTIIITFNLTSGCYMQSLVKFSEKKDDLTSSFATLLSVVLIIYLFLFSLFSNQISNIIGLPKRYIYAMFVSIWSTSMFLFWTVRQRVELNYRAFVTVSIVYTLLVSVFSAICVYITPYQYKADARIYSYVITCFLVYIYFAYTNFKKGKIHFSLKIWKRALRYNIPLLPHYLSQVLLNQFSRVQVSVYCGISQAGIFGLAYSIGMAIQMLNTSIFNVMTPWMYNKIKYKKIAEIPMGFNPLFIVIFFVCLILVAGSPEIVSFFAPSEYGDAALVVPPIALCVYFMFAQSFFDNYILYFEKTIFLSIASIVVAVVNVLSNAVIIPKFGFIAAGYSLLVCFILSSMAHCFVSCRVLKGNIGSYSEIPFKFVFILGFILILLSFMLIILKPFLLLRCLIITFASIILVFAVFKFKNMTK